MAGGVELLFLFRAGFLLAACQISHTAAPDDPGVPLRTNPRSTSLLSNAAQLITRALAFSFPENRGNMMSGDGDS